MKTPISPETHLTYQSYNRTDTLKLIGFMYQLKVKATKGGKTPYTPLTFIKHAEININTITELEAASHKRKEDFVNVPANIIFWVYRACIAGGWVCPVTLPHICKLSDPLGETFFVATKEEWQQHREATYAKADALSISDHAKIQYLTRVKGFNMEKAFEDFPESQLKKGGELLGDGRHKYHIGNYVYIMDGNVCVTVLPAGMTLN